MAKRTAIGVDIGGSGIKGAVVDLDTGEFLSERVRIPTPAAFTPPAVSKVVADVVSQLDHEGPIGIGFPAVVRSGVIATPPTALSHPGWVGVDLVAAVTRRLDVGTEPNIGLGGGSKVTVVNDADAAGLAEIGMGAAKGHKGKVLVLTLGTGIGSALFVNGELLANTELGRVYLGGPDTAEHLAADRVRSEQGLSWKKWAARLEGYLNHLDLIVAPDLIVLGGGVSKKHHKYLPRITTSVPVVPAEMRNNAGIIGAAAAGAAAV